MNRIISSIVTILLFSGTFFTKLYGAAIPIIDDDFNNNKSKWRIEETDRYYNSIQNGKYYAKHKSEGVTVFICWGAQNKGHMDTFTVESVMRRISGVGKDSYGVAFGLDMKGNRWYVFGINEAGNAALYFYDGAKWNHILESDPKRMFFKDGDFVKLSAVVKDGTVYCFVNGQLLGFKKGIHLYGDTVGMEAGSDLEVEADSFRLYRGIPDDLNAQIEAMVSAKEPSVQIYKAEISPVAVEPGGKFSLGVDYMILDGRLPPNGKIAAKLIYSIKKKGAELFQRSADLNISNGSRMRFKKDGLIASKESGSYVMEVKIQYGISQSTDVLSFKIN